MEKTREQLEADYYPNWLRTIVRAFFDPGLAVPGLDLSRLSETNDAAPRNVVNSKYKPGEPFTGGGMRCPHWQFTRLRTLLR